MSQKQINIQEQKQIQQQNLTPLQLQVVKMLEMPLAQMEDHIEKEIDVNPSLEAEYQQDGDNFDAYDTRPQTEEKELRQDALTDALERIGQDDRMDATPFSDDYIPHHSAPENQNFLEPNALTTFMDSLYEQMRMEELSDTEKEIMEYLIGSLDDDGLLRKDISLIVDELAFLEGLFVTEEEVEDVLLKLQEFNPAGIGARNLQECLTIQIERMKGTKTAMIMYDVITKCFNDFLNNKWDNICRTLSLTKTQGELVRKEIRHSLNPKPGAAFGESQERSLQQVTPDFLVNIDDDGTISFELNNGRIPILHVVKKDEELIEKLQGTKNKAEKEALAFTEEYVNRARMYIDAIQQRNETMVLTMKEIIKMQRKYFLSGDETDIRPMVLKDIAERTGLDASTISRVSQSKYVQTPWGIFPLKHLFSGRYNIGDGTSISTTVIKKALQEVIASEDKKKPLSDDKLTEIMKEKGYPIARRTVAKYREQMNIPSARLRKE